MHPKTFHLRGTVCVLLLQILCTIVNSSRAALPGDEHWDNQFGPIGPNSALQAIAAIGNNVYVGGSFTAAGNTKASAVARFDGTNWFPLNAGLLGTPVVVGVRADGNNVYVGGIFTNADDPTGIDTARWDGTNWSGIGISGVMFVVKRNGGDLYFGGSFTSAGGVPMTTNIARWDGTNWYSVGSGVTGNLIPSAVTCIEFQGNNMYVGGTFTNAGGVIATNVAYYDGSMWHSMGNPFNGGVNGLAFFGSYLYAGGFFTNSTLHFTNLARWDGSTWSAVPGGGANRTVSDLVSTGTNIFVSGSFTQVGGITAGGIASFDGSAWSPVGGSVIGILGSPGQVNKMLWQSNQLYIVGGFEKVGNTGADNVARWDGTNWWSLGGMTSKGLSPAPSSAQCLFAVNGPGTLPTGIYAGGLFGEAGDLVVGAIGLWDGTNWNALGSGVSGSFPSFNGPTVRAMATDGTLLYAAGSFSSAGGNPASGIASWDGSNWSPLGAGVDSVVNALAMDNANILYVGGGFTNAGGGFSKGLAGWSAGNWYNFGTVDGTNGTVNALAFDGGTKLYVGGSFLTAGGISASNVAYLDESDSSWHTLGAGFNAKINTLAFGNGILYAGGSFTSSGNVVLNHIAQWDGTSWSPLGSGGIKGGSTVIVNSILVVGTNVYATGNFTNAGGVTVTNIARWDGSTWSAMGSGLDISRAGFVLAANGSDLYVGGNFLLAGDKPAQTISRWNDQMNFYQPANMILTRTAWQTNRQFRFRLNGTTGQSYIIQGSTNLTTWTPLVTNSVMFYDFVDTNASSFSKQFYRAMLGP